MIKNKLFLILLLCLCVYPAIRSIFGSGYYSLHDDLHVAWLYEMDRAFHSGQIPPRWVPDLSFGYGYPLFNFVYPLPFYLGETFHLFGLDFVSSIKAVFIVSVLFSAIGMFLYLKNHTSQYFAFMGSILYVYTPYRAVTLYIRGAIGEALIFAIVPFVLYFLDKIFQSSKWSFKAWTALFLALLIISHNIGAFMILPFLFIYGLMWALKQKNKRIHVFNLILVFFWGSLISMYFWLPALYEAKHLVYGTVFNFQDHFPFLKELFSTRWGYGISIPGAADSMPFQIGMTNLVSVLMSLILVVFLVLKRQILRVETMWALILFVFCLFLMNIRSSFLWQTIPLLPYFQFPWRFLMLTSITTPILFISISDLPINIVAKKMFISILILFAFFQTNSYFRPEKYFPWRTDDYFINTYLPNRTLTGYKTNPSPEYFQNTEEYLRLPIATQFRPAILPTSKIESLQGTISYKEITSIKYQGEISTAIPTQIILNQYNFPGWKAFLDSSPVKISTFEPYATVAISVPPGEHQFSFYFSETIFRQGCNLISLTFLCLVFFIPFLRKNRV